MSAFPFRQGVLAVVEGIIDFYFHFFPGSAGRPQPDLPAKFVVSSVRVVSGIRFFSFCQGQAGTRVRIYILHAIIILVLPFLFFSSSFFVLLRAPSWSRRFSPGQASSGAGEKSFVVLGEKREEKEKYNIIRSSRRSSSRLSSWSLNLEPLGIYHRSLVTWWTVSDRGTDRQSSILHFISSHVFDYPFRVSSKTVYRKASFKSLYNCPLSRRKQYILWSSPDRVPRSKTSPATPRPPWNSWRIIDQ